MQSEYLTLKRFVPKPICIEIMVFAFPYEVLLRAAIHDVNWLVQKAGKQCDAVKLKKALEIYNMCTDGEYCSAVFARACELGDEEKIKMFSAGDKKINFPKGLSLARINNHKNIVNRFFEGIPSEQEIIELIEYSPNKSLVLAAEKGYLEIVKKIYTSGKLLVSKIGLLRSAAIGGHLNVLKYFAEQKISPFIALSVAAKYGRFETVKYMLEFYPQDRNPVNSMRVKTAINKAITQGHFKVVRLLSNYL